MSYQTERALKIISIILTIGFVGIFFFAYRYDKEQEKKHTAALEVLMEKARPYENEQRELENELHRLKNDAEYAPEKAEIMVGFLMSDADDSAYIKEKAEKYGFSPIVVIDCTADLTSITACIEAIDAAWEIMLYAPAFSSEIGERVIVVKNYLKSINKKDIDVFFLKNGYNTTGNIEVLTQNGFIGYTTYHDTPTFGQTEDGYVYFDYSHIRTGNTAIYPRLLQCYLGKASHLLVFDMESIETKKLSEKDVTAILDDVQKNSMRDDCSFASVSEVISALSKINQIKAEKQAEYEEKAEQITKRIEELELIIREIYAEREKY